ncbi:hypothetical protein Gobs_2554 [Geodermatophilus obscurus DSM 43160]|uniref:Uncharacterized protein n=1 Tax=Geodermatophilus obscurus (strain ATCC 25078 / DSM 43160 / JCM 3152 / CCUG 61914 / KCC A-0152 / KCTC 9177 / NBRC 13315 / NRRL B-3577 / G-20) TaxID=526225 RepID=D2S5D5_GEOOG|nr:hypothetical protein Gobs_2554 [Geodermatophilus obscurus DSM 43160]
MNRREPAADAGGSWVIVWPRTREVCWGRVRSEGLLSEHPSTRCARLSWVREAS